MAKCRICGTELPNGLHGFCWDCEDEAEQMNDEDEYRLRPE